VVTNPPDFWASLFQKFLRNFVPANDFTINIVGFKKRPPTAFCCVGQDRLQGPGLMLSGSWYRVENLGFRMRLSISVCGFR